MCQVLCTKEIVVNKRVALFLSTKHTQDWYLNSN